ncbi:MAG: RNA polymerase sigma factor [Holophagales bacterium]|nr:RNA polymerase sigma factor [Holophagales bacterium]MYD23259.1 RNA polymerase sigma factor [Holophagales bacterium]MYI33093.1 RNA polymerase sigma factor [Holophagales bacterium]
MAEAVQHVFEGKWASTGARVTSVPVKDGDLVRAAAGGDREAFAALLDLHYDRIFRLCFRLTGRREEAEDLTQDICLALPAKLKSFRGQARLMTWLYRIAVNAAHDRRRRDSSRTKAADGWRDWEVNRRATARDTAAGLDWLRRTMAALPGDLRDTVALTIDGEMTHAQAAEVLGVSEGTVSWRLSEVRKRLRAMWQEETGR